MPMVPPKLSEIKKKLIQSIKAHYTQYVIYPTYPVHRQINLSSGAIDDAEAKTAMTTFISGKLADIEEIETEINAIEDGSLVLGFTTGSDASMKAFVAGKLTLSKDEQKIAVALAVQSLGPISEINEEE